MVGGACWTLTHFLHFIKRTRAESKNIADSKSEINEEIQFPGKSESEISEIMEGININEAEDKIRAEEKETALSCEWVTVDSNGKRSFKPADIDRKKPAKQKERAMADQWVGLNNKTIKGNKKQ
jgi:hypothetical protein